MKSVRIRSYFGLYSVRMWENTDQNSSEYGHSLHSVYYILKAGFHAYDGSQSQQSLCFSYHVLASTV